MTSERFLVTGALGCIGAWTIRTLVDDIFRPAERVTGSIPPHEIDELLLLSSWFRRFPQELERTQPAAKWAARRSA